MSRLPGTAGGGADEAGGEADAGYDYGEDDGAAEVAGTPSAAAAATIGDANAGGDPDEL